MILAHLTKQGLCIYRNFGVEVKDFGPSWRDGYAFNALIHRIRPELVDMSRLPQQPNRVNLEQAFDKAEKHLGIPRLLDAEGMHILFCILLPSEYQHVMAIYSLL